MNGLETVAVSLVAGGAVALGAGLYKLGITLGQLTQAMRGFEARLERVEDHLTKP